MPTTAHVFTGRKTILICGALVAFAIVLWLVLSATGKPAELGPEQVAQNVAEASAQAENPFRADNPLSGVEADPLQKTKKVLNPFEE